jgi:hypothetical protein
MADDIKDSLNETSPDEEPMAKATILVKIALKGRVTMQGTENEIKMKNLYNSLYPVRVIVLIVYL